MCIRVVLGDVDPARPKWDQPNVSIVIAYGLSTREAAHQARTLLTFLGARQAGPQPTCWCGDLVTLPRMMETTPSQQAAVQRERIRHGA